MLRKIFFIVVSFHLAFLGILIGDIGKVVKNTKVRLIVHSGKDVPLKKVASFVSHAVPPSSSGKKTGAAPSKIPAVSKPGTPKKVTKPLAKGASKKNIKSTPPAKKKAPSLVIPSKVEKKNEKKSEIVEEQVVQVTPSPVEIDEKVQKVYPDEVWKVPVLGSGVPTLFSNASESDEEGVESYPDQLIFCLRQTLNLPEYGEVKIQLTLNDDGSVLNMKVLQASSLKNRAYLEKRLPELVFPRPENNEHNFILTFCNEN